MSGLDHSSAPDNSARNIERIASQGDVDLALFKPEQFQAGRDSRNKISDSQQEQSKTYSIMAPPAERVRDSVTQTTDNILSNPTIMTVDRLKMFVKSWQVDQEAMGAYGVPRDQGGFPADRSQRIKGHLDLLAENHPDPRMSKLMKQVGDMITQS